MNSSLLMLAVVATAAIVSACASEITPTYQSSAPDLLRIGGEKPSDQVLETRNLGTFCLQVQEKWKSDGKTPDGKTIWSKDTVRKTMACR